MSPALVALREAYFRQQPRSYLYFGVTQLLDVMAFGNGLETFESQPVHPDLFHCGAAPVLDGYPTAMLPQAGAPPGIPGLRLRASEREEASAARGRERGRAHARSDGRTRS